MPVCCIKSCGAGKNANQPHLTFHSFPRNEALNRKWLSIIGSDYVNTRYKNWYVCSLHFEENCINRTLSVPTLIDGALPSLLLKEKTPIVTKIESVSADRNEKHHTPICRACLHTDRKLFPIQRHKLGLIFTQVTGTTFKSTDKLPQNLCMECVSYLENFRKFKLEARKARNILDKILMKNGEISSQAVKEIGKISSRFSLHHLDPVHCDGSFNENMIIKTELDHDYNKLNEDIKVSSTINVIQSNFIVFGQDNKKRDIGKVEPPYASDKACELETDEHEEMEKDFETVEDVVIIKLPEFIEDVQSIEHVKINKDVEMVENVGMLEIAATHEDVETDENEYLELFEDIKKVKQVKLIEDPPTNHLEPTGIHNTETIENNEIINQFSDDYDDKQSDLESDTSNNSKVASGIERRRKSSTDELIEEVKNRLKKCKEQDKDRFVKRNLQLKTIKRLNSQIKKPIKTDATLVVSEYFTLKVLTTEEQIKLMKKRETNPKFINCPFKCKLCYKGFAIESKYSLHMVNHSEARGSFVCEICKCRYVTRRKLLHHHNGSHLRLYACKKCDFQTTSLNRTTAHVRLHRGKVYECKACNTTYRHNQTYLSHMRLSHPSSHVCALCASTFVTEWGLKMHLRMKHVLDYRPIPDDGPVCDVCNVKFVSKDVLAAHMRTSHKESKPTRLEVKLGKASGADPLKTTRPRKRANYIREPPPPCSEVNNSTLLQREESDSSIPRRAFECGKQLRSPQALFAHLRRLHPNCATLVEKMARRNFLCDMCGVSFSASCLLEEHRALHTLGRIPCDECGRSFGSVVGLRCHKEKHRGITYSCTICDMVFTKDGNRRRHEKTVHETKRLEACEVCGKTFKCSASKMSHEQHVHYDKPWPVRKRDRATEGKRKRRQSVTVVKSGESQDNGLERGLCKPQPKRSKTAKRKRLRGDDDDTDEDADEQWSE